MDWTALVQLIGNLGFPVAISCYLLWQNTKFVEAINNNTVAINTLKERIEKND